MKQTIIKQIEEEIKLGRVSAGIDLRKFNTMKIGGKGAVIVETVQPDELVKLIEFLKKESIKYMIIGGGSNIIFSDNGYDGVLIKIPSSGFKIVKNGTADVFINYSAGFSSHLAAVKCLEMSLSGFEGLYGLPGTIGGAVYMNSKWPKNNYQISDNIIEVGLIDNQQKYSVIKAKDIKFDYGYSSLQLGRSILINATFVFKKKPKTEIEAMSRNVMSYRNKTQPMGVITAGCIFKNITETTKKTKGFPTNSAGYLIDICGLKNSRSGKLVISNIHANFFVNEGGATSTDYLRLLNKVRETVYQKHKIELKEEVMYIE